MKQLKNILRSIPFLAVVTEGYAVGISIARELEWNVFVVVAASLLVALTGFWGVQVWNSFSEFNATLRKSERSEIAPLPTWKPTVILLIWFGGVVLLTVFLDVSPVLHTWAPPGLVVIGFSSSFLFSLSNLHATSEEERVAYRQRKEMKREEERKEVQQERKERKEQDKKLASMKQAIATKLQGTGARKVAKSGAKLSDELLLLKWAWKPDLTPTAMAEHLYEREGITVSRQAVSQRLDKLIERGLVVKTDDGRVVEVIGVATPVEAGEG